MKLVVSGGSHNPDKSVLTPVCTRKRNAKAFNYIDRFPVESRNAHIMKLFPCVTHAGGGRNAKVKANAALQQEV